MIRSLPFPSLPFPSDGIEAELAAVLHFLEKQKGLPVSPMTGTPSNPVHIIGAGLAG